jgi:putative PIN family toxin of toxin-antitoxin system
VKVVLDTNIWISSLLLPKSIPGKIIQAWKDKSFDVVISSYILEEFKQVLEYPKIKKRLTISNEEIEDFFALIRFFTEWVDIENVKAQHRKKIRDENSEPILTTFILSQSDYLITGDKDLLEISSDYPILTPGQFAEMI